MVRVRVLGLTSADRVGLLRRGIALEAMTVGYNAVEGLVAIVAGLVAGSVALTGFGIDWVIEVVGGSGRRACDAAVDRARGCRGLEGGGWRRVRNCRLSGVLS